MANRGTRGRKPRSAAAISGPAKPAQGPVETGGERFELGPFWLWYRRDRDDWNICWLDGRVTRRKASGIGGDADYPPAEACDALGDHWAEWKAETDRIAPKEALGPDDVLLDDIVAAWLEEHVAGLDAPERYLDSVDVWGKFWAHLSAQQLLPEPLTVRSITNGIVTMFIEWRQAQDVSAPTISRDLAALRSPLNWATKPGVDRLKAAPRIRDIKGRKKPKELEWTPEQVGVILEAAASSVERHHVHLFSMIMLSAHARVEATLELDADEQIRRGMIHFLRPDEDQTRKRRTIVPICPTLAPWLAGLRGKAIVYRAPIAQRRWANSEVPEFFERPTLDIDNAFAGTLRAAHAMRPDLGFAEQAIGKDGEPVWLEPRKKLGETQKRPKMVAIGTPNTLRHTIHTWHKRMGTPEAQIDAAAGHSEEGTGANYTHLRPEYLREFILNTELFWEAVGETTDAHLRYQRDTNVAELASARVIR